MVIIVSNGVDVVKDQRVNNATSPSLAARIVVSDRGQPANRLNTSPQFPGGFRHSSGATAYLLGGIGTGSRA